MLHAFYHNKKHRKNNEICPGRPAPRPGRADWLRPAVSCCRAACHDWPRRGLLRSPAWLSPGPRREAETAPQDVRTALY